MKILSAAVPKIYFFLLKNHSCTYYSTNLGEKQARFVCKECSEEDESGETSPQQEQIERDLATAVQGCGLHDWQGLSQRG